MSALSEPMLQALISAMENGHLERWVGGFWTVPRCKIKGYQDSVQHRRIPVPGWHVGVGTIMALVQRGYLEITERDPKTGWELKAAPTQKARNLI